MTLQNEKFEELIAEHLTHTLDPQRGKALAAFRTHLAAQPADTAPIPLSRGLQGQVSRRALWLWTGIPSLAAACLAVVVMLQLGVLGRKPLPNPGSSAPPGNVVASSVEVTQNQTGAIVVSDNTPMREVRQQTLRQTQWVDPKDHAVYTVTEPTEKVDYIQVHPN